MGKVSTNANQKEVDMWMKNCEANRMLINFTSKPSVLNCGNEGNCEVRYSNARYSTKSPLQGAKITLSKRSGIHTKSTPAATNTTAAIRNSTARRASKCSHSDISSN